MRPRSIVAWLLVIACIAGLVGVGITSHPAAQAQLRYETRIRTFRFDGHVGPKAPVEKFWFAVPAVASAHATVAWPNTDAKLALRVRRDGARVSAVDWGHTPRRAGRLYRPIDEGRYRLRITSIEGAATFTATVRVTWTVLEYSHKHHGKPAWSDARERLALSS